MAAKPPTALDEARAAIVLDSIGPRGERLGAAWYDWLRHHGLSRAKGDRAVDALAAAGKPTASYDRQTLSALEQSGAKPGEALMVAECDMVLIMFGQCQGVRLRQGLKDLSLRKLRMVRDLIETCVEDNAEAEPPA